MMATEVIARKDDLNVRFVFTNQWGVETFFEFEETEKVIPYDTYSYIEAFAKEGYKITKLSFNGGSTYNEFTISVDGKTATITEYEFDPNYNTDMDMRGSYIITEVDQKIPDVVGFNNLYSLSIDQLLSFTNERFKTGYFDNPIDLTQYIINIISIPFTLPEEEKGDPSNIKVADKIFDTIGTELLHDDVVINLGEIDIPTKYNNSYDFIDTTVLLHLPFTQTIELPLEYTIGCKISIEYVIDLFNGSTTINIRSSRINNEIFSSTNIKVGKNIPFVNTNYEMAIVGTQDTSINHNNRLYYPFVEVVRNTPYNIESDFNSDVLVQTKLSEEKGFVRVENISLETIATSSEKEYIVSILEKGVFIR